MTEQAAGGTPGAGGTPAQANGQDGQPQPTPDPKRDAGGTGQGDGQDELAGLRSALRAERDARREADRQAGELAGRIKALETKDLPEAERDKRELAELRERVKAQETRERTLILRAAVTTTAARLGFADPVDAYRLLDTDEIEFDKSGEPKDVDKRLADLLRSKPYLASAAARPTGSADGGQRGATLANDMNAAIRRAAGRN